MLNAKGFFHLNKYILTKKNYFYGLIEPIIHAKNNAYMRCELKLVEIELQNFRLFEHIKVQFDDKLTVLISENGAGKTAFLEGIAKALTILTHKITTITPYWGDDYNFLYQTSDIRFGQKEANTNITVQVLENNVINEPPMIWEILQVRRAIVTGDIGGVRMEKLVKDIQESEKQDNLMSLPVIVYFSTERALISNKDKSDYDTDVEIFNTYDNALSGNTLNFKWFLEWFIWKEDNAETSQLLLKSIKEAIFGLLNDENNHFRDIYSDRSRKKDYRLILEKNNGEQIEANQLSSGQKSLFVLVSDLARRLSLANPLSKNPLQDGQGIVLIDEIDLHLHPRWQRKVIGKLQTIFPKIQWVITTHSPQVLMNVKRENVKVLDNGQLTDAPFVEGRDANALSTDVFGLTKRLPQYEQFLDKIYDLIDKGQVKQAETAIASLKQKWGEADLDLHRAESFLEIL